MMFERASESIYEPLVFNTDMYLISAKTISNFMKYIRIQIPSPYENFAAMLQGETYITP